MRGATAPITVFSASSLYFNPRSPCGERLGISSLPLNIFYFNPRSPCGERQCMHLISSVTGSISTHAPRAGSDQGKNLWAVKSKDFNPRSPCGERPQHARLIQRACHISTHAPRAGSDPPVLAAGCFPRYFNPRSPCGERPWPHTTRGAAPAHFNPRSPCGERHSIWFKHSHAFSISTHAPRAGSDRDLV